MISNRLLKDTIDSIHSENMNEALTLSQKMDALLNQLKVCITTPALTSRLWAEPTNFLAAASSNHSWQKLQCSTSVISTRSRRSELRDQSVVSHYPNTMGTYTTYEDSMFVGANSVSIYNCTFNNIAGQTDAVEAINVSDEHYCYLPSATHFQSIEAVHTYFIHAGHRFIWISRSH